ncbi:MAG: hypothetical protein RR495_00905 [Anaerovoracaceae bacterium]
MKNIKCMMLAILLIALSTSFCFAASTKAIIACDSGVDESEAFTVSIKYVSEDISRVTSKLEYDTNLLEYISGGDSQGNSGVVSLKGTSTDGKNIVIKLKFKGLKKGTSDIKLITKEAYNMSEELIDIDESIKTIRILDGEVAEENESVKENPAKEEITANDLKEEPLQDNIKRPIIFYGGIIGIALILILIVLISSKMARKRKAKKR